MGTLVVNLTGSFLLGVLSSVTPPAFTVIGVGGLGAYTTFSSFAHDAIALARRKQLGLAGVYIGVSCLSIGAAALGMAFS